jgi:uncharacterized membrane protein
MTPKTAKPSVEDNHTRSLAKAISWRAAGTLDTIAVSCIITGHLKVALSIGFVELFTKICLYYLHERLWNRIPFGQAKAQDDYEI